LKKIILSMALIAFMSGAAFAANDGGGKKKARKKAKTECKIAKCDPKNCDLKTCDPNNCDPKNCDPKCVELASASREVKCTPGCSGN
jgi:hypothetical protein